jgi:hypothetical protein
MYRHLRNCPFLYYNCAISVVPVIVIEVYFCLLQLKRLEKLGINKTDPETLTPDEQKAFARLNINVNTITWYRGEFYFLFYFFTPSQLHYH